MVSKLINILTNTSFFSKLPTIISIASVYPIQKYLFSISYKYGIKTLFMTIFETRLQQQLEDGNFV